MSEIIKKEEKLSVHPALSNPENIKDFEAIKDVIMQMIGNLQLSHQLIDYGVTDSITDAIHRLITQPKIATGYSFLEKAQEIIFQELYKVVNKFLEKNLEILDKVFLVKDEKNKLFYCLILKEDIIENRAKLNEFLVRYQSTPFEKNFPLIFQYIPKNLQKEINGIEITFN